MNDASIPDTASVMCRPTHPNTDALSPESIVQSRGILPIRVMANEILIEIIHSSSKKDTPGVKTKLFEYFTPP